MRKKRFTLTLIGFAEPIVDKYDVSSLKYVMSGAAPLGVDLQKRLQKRLNCYVTQGYGLTESSPTSHYSPYDKARIGSAGMLLPNVQGRIVDPVTMKDMPNVGDEGEIWMKGPIIMKGVSGRLVLEKLAEYRSNSTRIAPKRLLRHWWRITGCELVTLARWTRMDTSTSLTGSRSSSSIKISL